MSDAVGEDRSGYQAVSPWKQDFGICKVTEGTSIVDSAFKGNWAGLKSAGIPRFGYHFFRPALSATAQAQFFAKTLKAEGLDQWDGVALDVELTLNSAAVEVMGTKMAAAPRMVLPPMPLDVYGPSCKHDPLPTTVDGAHAWCEHCNQYCIGVNRDGQQVKCAGCVSAMATALATVTLQGLVEEFISEANTLLGVRPRLLYTYQDMAGTSFNEAFAEANPNLWVASYGVDSPGTGPWKTWKFWQFEGGGGPGGGDRDYYNGDKAQLTDWVDTFRTEPKPPASPIPAWQHAIIARLPELRNGSKDTGGQTQWVKQAQLLLDVVAVDSVTADGSLGPLTEESLKKTQASRKLPQTGVTDPETWQVLIAGQTSGVLPSSVAKGAADHEGATFWVHRIQALLEAHSIPTSIDGDYGDQTETGVKTVQKAYGEPETGVVNETTWSLLIAHAKP